MGNVIRNAISKTSIACMTDQAISLRVMDADGVRDADEVLQRRLHRAIENVDHFGNLGINAKLRLDRNDLRRLASHMNIAPQYRVMVDGNKTTFIVAQDALLRNSLIICRVVNNQVAMHGLEDREAPRQDNNINWITVGQNYAHGQYDAMNLGSGIRQNP